MIRYPQTPKAGVYAVRMGPVLSHNLEAVCRGASASSFRQYHPQKQFLALLATGSGRAIASWGGRATTARSAWRLKRFIDLRFLNGLRVICQ